MALADYLVPVGSKCNICFDCKNACGDCSWTEVDPHTGQVRFEPVPGWTAEKVSLNLGKNKSGGTRWVITYRITGCPLFERDDYRPSNNVMLTETESKQFLENINMILRRWNTDG